MPAVTDEQTPPTRRRGRYPRQFRKDAAALAIDQHRTIADVARELGVIEQLQAAWRRITELEQSVQDGAIHRHRRWRRREDDELSQGPAITAKDASYGCPYLVRNSVRATLQMSWSLVGSVQVSTQTPPFSDIG
jgi:transposase-like protein